MTKPNLAAVSQSATDLRQRAARTRDAAGRFIKRVSPAEPTAEVEPPAPPVLPSERVLAEASNLANVPLSTLLAVHDVAHMLSDLAAAITCQPRCYVDYAGDCTENAAGTIASWICEACGHVADAAIAEARRREPRSHREAVSRLSVIGRSDVESGERARLSHLVTDVAALSASRVQN